MFHHRRCQRRISAHPLMEDRFHIIRALDQRCAFYIAYRVEFRRLQVNVVNALAGWTVAPTRNTTQQLSITYQDAYRNQRQPVRDGRQPGIQPLRLAQGSRIAIQNVAANGIRLLQPFCDHLVDQIVGNQLARIHDLGGQQPQSGVPFNRWSRSKSPVEIWGMPQAAMIPLAWVPLPTPGAPISSMGPGMICLEDGASACKPSATFTTSAFRAPGHCAGRSHRSGA